MRVMVNDNGKWTPMGNFRTRKAANEAAELLKRNKVECYIEPGRNRRRDYETGPVGEGEREERANDAWATRMGYTD